MMKTVIYDKVLERALTPRECQESGICLRFNDEGELVPYQIVDTSTVSNVSAVYFVLTYRI